MRLNPPLSRAARQDEFTYRNGDGAACSIDKPVAPGGFSAGDEILVHFVECSEGCSEDERPEPERSPYAKLAEHTVCAERKRPVQAQVNELVEHRERRLARRNGGGGEHEYPRHHKRGRKGEGSGLHDGNIGGFAAFGRVLSLPRGVWDLN